MTKDIFIERKKYISYACWSWDKFFMFGKTILIAAFTCSFLVLIKKSVYWEDSFYQKTISSESVMLSVNWGDRKNVIPYREKVLQYLCVGFYNVVCLTSMFNKSW